MCGRDYCKLYIGECVQKQGRKLYIIHNAVAVYAEKVQVVRNKILDFLLW